MEPSKREGESERRRELESPRALNLLAMVRACSSTPELSQVVLTPATEERKLDSPLEDPALKADLNAAVSRLLRKEIESVGTDAPSTH